MISTAVTVYLTCLVFGETIGQKNAMEPSSIQKDSGFLSLTIGENLTLHCFNYGDDASARHYWYIMPLGQRPQKISSFYVYEKKRMFYGDFENNPRFSLDVKNGQNHLTITDLQISDSATYYCFTSYVYKVNFTKIVTVSVTGLKEKAKSFVLHSESDSVQRGSSVTLNCTVYTGSCNGEHKLYWFRSSVDSQPGYIYTDGRNAQCDTQTDTCVYQLPMNSLSPSDAGIYYCAVASCGQVLFGNGTKLVVTDDAAVYFWKVAFALISILSASLAFLPCLINTNRITDTKAGLSSPSNSDFKGHHQQGSAFFTRWQQQRDSTWSECIYSCVEQ